MQTQVVLPSSSRTRIGFVWVDLEARTTEQKVLLIQNYSLDGCLEFTILFRDGGILRGGDEVDMEFLLQEFTWKITMCEIAVEVFIPSL